MLGDRDDIRARNFGDGDTAIGLVGRVKIDVVGSDTGSNCQLKVRGLLQALGGQVAWVKAVDSQNLPPLPKGSWCPRRQTFDCERSGASNQEGSSFSWPRKERAGVSQLEGGAYSTYGVVIITSASTSSWSNFEFSPSLSEVVTRVWPWSSIHFLRPSSFSVVPSRRDSSWAC